MGDAGQHVALEVGEDRRHGLAAQSVRVAGSLAAISPGARLGADRVVLDPPM